MPCPDCANPALEYRVGHQCAYCALVTGNDADPRLQALAVMIDPKAFEEAAKANHYFTLAHPTRGRKFGPWDERGIWSAYDAARRVAIGFGLF